MAITDGEAAAQALAEGIAGLGIGRPPWTREQKALRERAERLRATVGEDWPDLSDAGLGADIRVAGAGAAGRTALGEVTATISWGRSKDCCPGASGRRWSGCCHRISMRRRGRGCRSTTGRRTGRLWEVRVQELFGLDRHPSVAGGKVPLLLVLLSPAHRPIQTTRDLPGFWRGSWKMWRRT